MMRRLIWNSVIAESENVEAAKILRAMSFMHFYMLLKSICQKILKAKNPAIFNKKIQIVSPV